MKTSPRSPTRRRSWSALALLTAARVLRADDSDTPAPAHPVITVDADQVVGRSSPILYGLMTEEINHSYDGGLYAELISNRSFQDDATQPAHWTVSAENGGTGSLALDPSQPLNDALKTSLKFEIASAGPAQRVGLSNDGFWGIPVFPSTTYHASFYAKAAPGFKSGVTVALASDDGSATFAIAVVPALTEDWKKYEMTLTTPPGITPSKANHLTLWATSAGTLWLQNVSLFPPTYHDRPNGNRPDLMRLLAEYQPAFLRFPGGNYLEGDTLATRFDWKKTIGDIAQRPGHLNDSWRYRSSDGMGLLEFLEWCEDLKMQPVLAVYAGLALRNGGVIAPGAALAPYVQDALDEIEYVTGGPGTPWGARRARDGHPAPFALTYVEIGNEDWRETYDGRFTQIYDAIKAKYPRLQLIDASARTGANGHVTTFAMSRRADVYDCHLYTNSEQQSEARSTDYDAYDRNRPKIFEGEWATRVGAPTPNMTGAIGDAAYMTGLERNSDIVIMASYAPLLVDVSDLTPRTGSMQWPTDLIGYDALHSYGSPAFYAQMMFNHNRGDQILRTTAAHVGSRTWQPPAPRGGGPPPPARPVPTLFQAATRDSRTGLIYLKVVNPLGTPQDVAVEINGAASVASQGESVILKANRLTDTNSIAEPEKIVPVTAPESGFGARFTRTLAPYSINILKISALLPAPADRVAAKPLFRDPVYDGAADPTLLWNSHDKKWYMFYTVRRANVPGLNGVGWVHGTPIGIATSSDGGASWQYHGTARINFPGAVADATYWAPAVVEHNGLYHMYLVYVPGTFSDGWNHPRDILHLTSVDMLSWDYQSTLPLEHHKDIDAGVLHLPDGSWRLWYKDEADHSACHFADSLDLDHWTDRGKSIGLSDVSGEAPLPFHWKGHDWLMRDVSGGLALYRSEDALDWQRVGTLLHTPGAGPDDNAVGHHPDVILSGDRAYIFYFTHPDSRGGTAVEGNSRRSSIQVGELHYDDASQALTVDRNQPTLINLQPPDDPETESKTN